MRATRSIVWIAILVGVACQGSPKAPGNGAAAVATGTEAARVVPMDTAASERRLALAEELRREGIRDGEVLRAMATVPRHEFVPAELAEHAYEDRPLPIGLGQTISQPYVVAYMTETLGVARGMRVLEIGTGSGYQAAVLAEVGAAVYSIEILPELSTKAGEALARAGYGRVVLRVGDGYAGWEEMAPFERIIVTAAADEIPPPLVAQLAAGGRIVMPVEDPKTGEQSIRIVDKAMDGSLSERRTLPVRFVPLTGQAERD